MKNNSSSIRRMTMMAMMIVVISICSWLTIPTAVPFTMQIFAVFFALLVLGGKDGTVAVGVYILMGAVGLPVFAGFQGGLGSLVGPTGGYIVGFLMIGVVYWIFEKKICDSVKLKIAVLILGLIVCYALGTIWFYIVAAKGGNAYGIVAILGMCVVPYILPDLAKLALAVYISGRVKKAMNKIQ